MPWVSFLSPFSSFRSFSFLAFFSSSFSLAGTRYNASRPRRCTARSISRARAAALSRVFRAPRRPERVGIYLAISRRQSCPAKHEKANFLPARPVGPRRTWRCIPQHARAATRCLRYVIFRTISSSIDQRTRAVVRTICIVSPCLSDHSAPRR